VARQLSGRRIAVPETRELDRLAHMLEERGATTMRCPLVAIRDAAKPTVVEDWLRQFVDTPFDDLVLFTGEGVRRLLAAARRVGIEAGFVAALRVTRKIARGPKPGQALRELGLQPDLRSEQPTTEGLVATLSGLELASRRIGVQLYPDAPDPGLVAFLEAAGATVFPVVPYAYASNADDRQVVALIDALAAGGVDVIAFTSSPQVRRLFAVAEATSRTETLRAGLRATVIAAVGPVVAGELRRHGLGAEITPAGTFFMKPLVSAIERACAGAPPLPP
jgi:uroporphyrinogen-III synthase